jgi:outer membrane lipoprotein-sorting protein
LPAGLVAVVLGGGVVLPTVRASAATDLPDRTAEQLLTDLQTAEVDGWSGTLSYTADLGLPALPEQMGGEHGTGLTSLLSGTHTLRAWAAEPDRFRVALHGSLGESDLVVDGHDVWAWSSDDRTATHLRLPEPPPGHGHGRGPDDAGARHGLPALTPEQVTERLLDALDPSTRVSTGPVISVAGRAAYQLVLEPSGPGSLLGSIRIAVDGTELVPTRVQVFPTGSTRPAVELGFTAVTFAVPADDVFAFTPPPGATVEEHDLSALRPHAPGARDADHPRGHGRMHGRDVSMPRPDVTVVGEGWAAVLVAGLSGGPGGPGADGLLGRALVQQLSRDDGELGAILSTLPEVSGAWGSGRLLTSRLFSVLLTDDGRVLVGAVDGATLQAAAATPAATD